MTDIILLAVCCGIGTFALTVILSRIIIPVLKSKHMGQKILEIGPRWHKSKEGTPTMGGISFIIAMTVMIVAAIVAISLITGSVPTGLTITFVYALASAFIGCIDDLAKLRHKRNDGLTPTQKLVLQIAFSAAYIFCLAYTGGIDTALYIPFAGVSLELGFVYYIFLLILAVGIVNSVNLSDGIDGLASSEVFVVSVFFMAAAFLKYGCTTDGEVGAGILGASMAGAALGFLVYNFHPARVFMGDTGSLFFGGLVIGGTILLGTPEIVIICGFMFVMESVSDILQVSYFKLTHGKRLFKMAPLHHHFEKCGWSEVKIVVIFSAVTAVFCVLAYFGLPPLYAS
ncbi:MAG: phospho-N-acetylmuramoyl-pentapeptide-transferase [Firmicutes bacterium]|nr:phospho-N-acetylmuramoyl-pentapeptide-transferase [Bacillota bacterium]